MATMIRDLTEAWAMPADSFAGVFRCHAGRYVVAWGDGYEAMRAAREWDRENTDAHGVEAFDSEDEANAYADEVAHAQG